MVWRTAMPMRARARILASSASYGTLARISPISAKDFDLYWSPIASGDFNHDGISDLIWDNACSWILL
jgi:hypothetical protein